MGPVRQNPIAYGLVTVCLEFIDKCGCEYKTALQERSPGLDTVVVPTSEQRPVSSSAAHGGNKNDQNTTVDSVDSTQYTRAVLPLCDRLNNSYAAFYFAPAAALAKHY